MSRNLFWLSDEQWARIEPQLPTDVRGNSGIAGGAFLHLVRPLSPIIDNRGRCLQERFIIS